MAIDPSISLQTKPPQTIDILGMANQAAQLQNARQQLINAQAQLPGIQAQSQSAQVTAQQDVGRQFAAQNAIDTNPDGSPMIDPTTGQPKINPAKYQYLLYKAGLAKEALQDEASRIGNLQQSQIATGKQIDMNNEVRNHLAVAAKAAYDQTQGTPEQKQAAAVTVWNGLADQAVKASQGPNKTPIDPNALTYFPNAEQTLFTAQIDPATQSNLAIARQNLAINQEQLKIAQGQFQTSQKANFADPDSLDANTPVSRFFQSTVKNATGEDVSGVSANALFNNPKYHSLLSSIGSTAGPALVGAKNTLNLYTNLGAVVDRAKDQLSAMPFTPAQFANNWVNHKIVATPELSALYGVLTQLPPDVVQTAQSWASLKAVAAAMQDQAKLNVQAAGGGGAPAAKVKMKAPDGRLGSVAPDQVQRLKSLGYTEVQ